MPPFNIYQGNVLFLNPGKSYKSTLMAETWNQNPLRSVSTGTVLRTKYYPNSIVKITEEQSQSCMSVTVVGWVMNMLPSLMQMYFAAFRTTLYVRHLDYLDHCPSTFLVYNVKSLDTASVFKVLHRYLTVFIQMVQGYSSHKHFCESISNFIEKLQSPEVGLHFHASSKLL